MTTPPRPAPCHICTAADCHELRTHPHDTCPLYTRIRDALLPAGDDLDSQAAHALFWLVRQLGILDRRERVRLTGELVALFVFARTIGPRITRANLVQALDDAWLLRCESSEPWPDSEPELAAMDPHDGTAKHVFDLLRAAVAGEGDEPDSEAH